MRRERVFLYFLPDETAKPTAATLAAFGLTDQLGVPEMMHCPITKGKGPSGTPGVTVSLEAKPPGYHPDEQTWIEIPAAGGRLGYWLGWWKGKLPRPQDLARTEQLSGHVVTLGDGNEWLVPCARLMPQTITALPEGGFGVKGMECHSWLWAIADEWYGANRDETQAVQAGRADRGFMEYSRAPEQCVRVLSANYHVGAPEVVTALELLTTGNMAAVLWSLCDYVADKKKADSSAPPESPPGPAAS